MRMQDRDFNIDLTYLTQCSLTDIFEEAHYVYRP